MSEIVTRSHAKNIGPIGTIFGMMVGLDVPVDFFWNSRSKVKYICFQRIMQPFKLKRIPRALMRPRKGF